MAFICRRGAYVLVHCHSKVGQGSRDVDYWLDLAEAQLETYPELDLISPRWLLKEALKGYEEAIVATKALVEHHQFTVNRHREERMQANLRHDLQMEFDALNKN
ncbi:hypothetical protein QAD02_019985 [Eretmocerus hayati]|uniref:Uncharacterized protein n=1 Tax=Eretmocerus hayati TaxID=131215 RepID=A0ACC2PMB5_9HYME|nr:hypothetical protein QAD02_019985 [Eretmocerus hayati]